VSGIAIKSLINDPPKLFSYRTDAGPGYQKRRATSATRLDKARQGKQGDVFQPPSVEDVEAGLPPRPWIIHKEALRHGR